jgi:hypothetical protein
VAAITTRTQAGVPHTALPGLLLQGIWYAVGAALAFAVPYVFSSVLELQHDLYLLIYFASIGAFLATYVIATHADVAGMFRRGWKLSLVLGAFATAFVVANVLSKDATPRPDGLYFVFETFWRGLAYGTMDALMLTAFPVLVAYRLLGDEVKGWIKHLGFAALALALIWIITAIYHLGYDQYREDGVGNPEIGNTVISVPAIVTTNPLGSVVAHAAMHVTAVSHAYETEIFLPPQTDAE